MCGSRGFRGLFPIGEKVRLEYVFVLMYGVVNIEGMEKWRGLKVGVRMFNSINIRGKFSVRCGKSCVFFF